MAIQDELIEELVKGYEKPEDLLGENGLLKEGPPPDSPPPSNPLFQAKK